MIQSVKLVKQFADLPWCDVALLKNAAAEVVRAYLNFHWKVDDFKDEYRDAFTSLLRNPSDLSGIPDPLHPKNENHRLYIHGLYALMSHCCYEFGGRSPTSNCKARSCIESLKNDQPGRQFEIPKTPLRVLHSSNDEAKAEALRFYQSQKRSVEKAMYEIGPEWERSLQFRVGVREAICSAAQDKESQVLLLLLRECTCNMSMTRVPEEVFKRAFAKQWRTSPQEIMALLVAAGHFESVQTFVKDLRTPLVPVTMYETLIDNTSQFSYLLKDNRGPAAMDDLVKCFVLELAEQAYQAGAETALPMLTWWVHTKNTRDRRYDEPVDSSDDDYEVHEEGELLDSWDETNAHALNEGNPSALRELYKIKEDARLWEWRK